MLSGLDASARLHPKSTHITI